MAERRSFKAKGLQRILAAGRIRVVAHAVARLDRFGLALATALREARS